MSEANIDYRLRAVGWLTLGFGLAGIFRLFPEFLGLHHTSDGYARLVFLEFIIGMTGFFSGLALLMVPSRWGIRLAALFWGASVSIALATALLSVDSRMHVNKSDLGHMLPRVLYCVFLLIVCPYSLWALGSRAEAADGGKGSVRFCFLLGLVGGLSGSVLAIAGR